MGGINLEQPECFPFVTALVYMEGFNGRPFGRLESEEELERYVDYLRANKRPVTANYVTQNPTKFLKRKKR